MTTPFYKSLWFRLFVRVSAVLVVVVSASFYFLINYERKDLIDNEIEATNRLGEVIKASISHGLLTNNESEIQEIISSVSNKNSGILSIYLYNKSGVIKYSSDTAKKGITVTKEKDFTCLICHNDITKAKSKSVIVKLENGKRILRNVNLVENLPACLPCHENSGKLLGNIVIDLSMDKIDAQLKGQLIRMLSSSTIAFTLIASLMFLATTLFVINPLKELRKNMHEAGKGNFNVSANIKHNDEIGSIAKTFNSMIGRINLLVEKLKIINRISISLSSIIDVDKMIEMIIDKSVEVMKAQIGFLMILDNKTGHLDFKYFTGISGEVAGSRRLKVGEGISGWVVKNGEAINVKSIESDERFNSQPKAGFERNSIISAPVIIKHRVVGVLTISNKVDNSIFSQDELDLLVTLAGQIAVVLENAKLYEELKQSYFDSIYALINAIEAKDSYTKGHSERVMKTALDISTELSLSDKQKQILQYAAILHDIGKIGVDLKILHKRGILTIEEFRAIQEHPQIGVQILEPVGFLREVKSIIEQHHERIDGTGYPKGLSQENLTIEARIIAVADAYDAMTSSRPYREPMPLDKVIEEFKENAGTQFDSEIVKIFLKMLMDKKAKDEDIEH